MTVFSLSSANVKSLNVGISPLARTPAGESLSPLSVLPESAMDPISLKSLCIKDAKEMHNVPTTTARHSPHAYCDGRCNGLSPFECRCYRMLDEFVKLENLVDQLAENHRESTVEVELKKAMFKLRHYVAELENKVQDKDDEIREMIHSALELSDSSSPDWRTQDRVYQWVKKLQ